MIYIIGYGEMAKAIIKGMKNKNFKDIAVVGRDKEKLNKIKEEFGVEIFLLDGFDLSNKEVILAVKPYALEDISSKLKGKAKILYSILAGKSINEIKKFLKADYYIRAMPNVAAAFCASTTAITGDDEVRKRAEEIFSSIGDVVWVDSDDEIDMATAIIGSGPAFLALIAEAISDGGVYIGLKRDVAKELTKGLFKSFSAIEYDFSKIKDKVMSPRGTTAEGVLEMEDKGVRGAMMKVIKKTYEKSKKI